MNLDEIKSEQEEITVIKLDDYLFEDEEALNNYLESCEAELRTFNFQYDRADFEKYMGSDFYWMFDWDSEDQVDEEEIDAAFIEFQERIDDLCEKYDIDFDFKGFKAQGPEYILTGTYGNLKKFAEEYASHLDGEDAGEALYDMDEDVDIDIDSGDEYFFLNN